MYIIYVVNPDGEITRHEASSPQQSDNIISSMHSFSLVKLDFYVYYPRYRIWFQSKVSHDGTVMDFLLKEQYVPKIVMMRNLMGV